MGDYGFGDKADHLKRSPLQTNSIPPSANRNGTGSGGSHIAVNGVGMGIDRVPPTYSEATKGQADISDALDVSPNFNFERSSSWEKQPSEHLPMLTAGPGNLSSSNMEKEDSDLQKAIALSLGEASLSRSHQPAAGTSGGKKVSWGNFGLSNEDTDISKALEESLKTGRAQETGHTFLDGNPNDRRRGADNWPLGLQNIGNTCWFSSVIQAFFNISAFRNLVLNFNPPLNAAPCEELNLKARKYFQFMKELRLLFASLIGSNRKYVNPRSSVEILKGAFEGNAYSNCQQDVSEFTSKLLEWVEEALNIYKSSCETPTFVAGSPSDKENKLMTSDVAGSGQTQLDLTGHSSLPQPCTGHDFSPEQMLHQLKQVFYGEIETHGLTDENAAFANREAFIQLPLQVRGFQTLYESIDASLQSEFTSTQSRGEQWIRVLPKVVIFNLNRFIYNPVSQRTEKIHDKLEFPNIVYFDRFLLANQSVTRVKRKEVAKLQEQLSMLKNQLKTLQEYGTKRLPLSESLQCVMEFASSLRSRKKAGGGSAISSHRQLRSVSESGTEDVEMRSPGNKWTQSSDTDGGVLSLPTSKSSPGEDDGTPLTTPSSWKSSRLMAASELFSATTGSVASDTDLIIETLSSWKSVVNQEIKALENSIQEITDKVDAMYSSESLKRVPYKLHAVLVHEGEALSGHYWCFVQPRRDHCEGFSPSSQCSSPPQWIKFNDTVVSSADKSEMQRESFGGATALRPTCSAYCLIYVDTRSNDIFEENGNVCLSALPEDLRLSVQEDNDAFAKEIENWNRHSAASGQRQLSNQSGGSQQQQQQHNGGDSWMSSSGCNNNNNNSVSNRNRTTNFTMAERDTDVRVNVDNCYEHGGEEVGGGGCSEESSATPAVQQQPPSSVNGHNVSSSSTLITKTSTPRGSQSFSPVDSDGKDDSSNNSRNQTIREFNFALSGPVMKRVFHKVSPALSSNANENAAPSFYSRIPKFLENVTSLFEQVLNGSYEEEERVSSVDEDPLDLKCMTAADVRLSHIAIFGMNLKVHKLVINKCILETFCILEPSCLTEDGKSMQNVARKFVETWNWPPDGVAFGQYYKLHEDYFQLYRVVCHFAEGFSQFQEGRYRVAMPQFINANHINMKCDKDPRRQFDNVLLNYFQRICFVNLGQEALDNVQSEDSSEQLEGIRLASELVIPVAGLLCKTAGSEFGAENNLAVEHVRAQWFCLLNQEISPLIMEKLQDVLSKLIDESCVIDLAYKVTEAVLTNGPPTPTHRNKSVEQLMHTVSHANTFRDSKTNEMMDIQYN